MVFLYSEPCVRVRLFWTWFFHELEASGVISLRQPVQHCLRSLNERLCVESSAVYGEKQRIADEAGSYSSRALTKWSINFSRSTSTVRRCLMYHKAHSWCTTELPIRCARQRVLSRVTPRSLMFLISGMLMSARLTEVKLSFCRDWRVSNSKASNFEGFSCKWFNRWHCWIFWMHCQLFVDLLSVLLMKEAGTWMLISSAYRW